MKELKDGVKSAYNLILFKNFQKKIQFSCCPYIDFLLSSYGTVFIIKPWLCSLLYRELGL